MSKHALATLLCPLFPLALSAGILPIPVSTACSAADLTGQILAQSAGMGGCSALSGGVSTSQTAWSELLTGGSNGEAVFRASATGYAATDGESLQSEAIASLSWSGGFSTAGLPRPGELSVALFQGFCSWDLDTASLSFRAAGQGGSAVSSSCRPFEDA